MYLVFHQEEPTKYTCQTKHLQKRLDQTFLIEVKTKANQTVDVISSMKTVCHGQLMSAQNRNIQLRSVKATLEGAMDIQGILGIDSEVRNGFDEVKVIFDIDADASRDDVEAIVAQSQKRSAVFDIMTNPTNVTVEVK